MKKIRKKEDIEEKLIGQKASNVILIRTIKALWTKLTIGVNNYWLAGLIMGILRTKLRNNTSTCVAG